MTYRLHTHSRYAMYTWCWYYVSNLRKGMVAKLWPTTHIPSNDAHFTSFIYPFHTFPSLPSIHFFTSFLHQPTKQAINNPTNKILPFVPCAASSSSSAPRPQPSGNAIGIRRGSRAHYALAGLPFVLLIGGTLYLGGSRMSRYKKQAHI